MQYKYGLIAILLAMSLLSLFPCGNALYSQKSPTYSIHIQTDVEDPSKVSNFYPKVYEVEPCDNNPSIITDMGINAFYDEGFNGSDINIAVIDTGMNVFDDRIKNRIILSANFIDYESNMDLHGHGTEIAGILTSLKSEINGFEFQGIARGANIINLKALDEEGYGSTSSIVSAIQYAIDLNNDANETNNVHILSLSFGTTGKDETIEAKVIDAWKSGIVVVCAGGNEGTSDSGNPVYYSVNSPGSALEPISVGAMYDASYIASYSSIGPSPNTYLVKPEIVSPGTHIITNGLYDNYVNVSGTSFSTPIVAGCLAIVLHKYNESYGTLPTPDQLKSALFESAISLGYNDYIQGAGVPDFVAMYDILTENKVNITFLPKYLEFPNYFDWEKEDINHYSAEDDVANVGSVSFPNYRVTTIVPYDLPDPISIIIDSSLENIISADIEENIQNAGQYVIDVDFTQPTNLFETKYAGNISIVCDGEIIGRIYIKVFASFWGNIKAWISTLYGKILMFLFPTGIVLTCGFVNSKRKKPVLPSLVMDRCPVGYKCVYNPETMRFDVTKLNE